MRAIITGASSGIGRAVAQRFATDSLSRDKEPARLVLVDKDSEGLEGTRKLVETLDANVVAHIGTLSDTFFCEDAVAKAQDAYGGLDVLVSNAGLMIRKSLLKLAPDEYEMMMSVNLRAAWVLARASQPLLAKSRGCIVATASIGAQHPAVDTGVYTAAKAGLIALVKHMAYEWGPDGIRCNTVSPGSVITGMSREKYEDQVGRKLVLSRIPLGIFGLPEHMASAVSYLASSEAEYISGVNLVVDGAQTAGLMRNSTRV